MPKPSLARVSSLHRAVPVTRHKAPVAAARFDCCFHDKRVLGV
jgi:hypothetical protein